MQIDNLIWLDAIVEKLDSKHSVSVDEVEEVFRSSPRFRRGKRGNQRGEDLYYAFGQTDEGRYLFIVFIFKRHNRGLILSARDMQSDERKWYQGK
jgi:uncharacterized protein